MSEFIAFMAGAGIGGFVGAIAMSLLIVGGGR